MLNFGPLAKSAYRFHDSFSQAQEIPLQLKTKHPAILAMTGCYRNYSVLFQHAYLQIALILTTAVDDVPALLRRNLAAGGLDIDGDEPHRADAPLVIGLPSFSKKAVS